MNPYPQPTHYAPAPRNGFGITALVLAIVGVAFGLVPLTGFIALILGALAVLFGLLGVARTRKGIATNGKMSTISVGLGVAVAALGTWGTMIVFDTVEQFERDVQQFGDFESVQVPSAAADPGAVPSLPATRVNTATDVKINGCTVETEYGMTTVQAQVTITNSSERQASYWATIAVDDTSGARLGEAYAYADHLRPGQSAQLSGPEASTMLAESVDRVTCSLVSVDRVEH